MAGSRRFFCRGTGPFSFPKRSNMLAESMYCYLKQELFEIYCYFCYYGILVQLSKHLPVSEQIRSNNSDRSVGKGPLDPSQTEEARKEFYECLSIPLSRPYFSLYPILSLFPPPVWSPPHLTFSPPGPGDTRSSNTDEIFQSYLLFTCLLLSTPTNSNTLKRPYFAFSVPTHRSIRHSLKKG